MEETGLEALPAHSVEAYPSLPLIGNLVLQTLQGCAAGVSHSCDNWTFCVTSEGIVVIPDVVRYQKGPKS